ALAAMAIAGQAAAFARPDQAQASNSPVLGGIQSPHGAAMALGIGPPRLAIPRHHRSIGIAEVGRVEEPHQAGVARHLSILLARKRGVARIGVAAHAPVSMRLWRQAAPDGARFAERLLPHGP